MPVLRVISEGALQGKSYEIGPSGVTVGRAPDNTIVLDDPASSGRHCRFDLQNSACSVTDLESTNGTLVNDKRVSRLDLSHGDVVSVGSVKIMLEDEQALTGDAPSKTKVSDRPNPAPAFGQHKDSRRLWMGITIAVSILAIAALVFFAVRFFAQ